MERVYAVHSSNVLTRSSPGAFSLTSNSLTGSACIHLRSHAVVIAWNATSVGSNVLRKGPTTEIVNWELTEFMTEIFRVDNGRRKRIRRVDVLSESRLVNHRQDGTTDSLTTEPRVNGCCKSTESGERRHKRLEQCVPDERRSVSRRKYQGLAGMWHLPQKARGTLPTQSRPRRTICAGVRTERPEGETSRCRPATG